MNNYSKDKKGWVTFNNGQPKQKLRFYIANLSKELNKVNKKPIKYNREKLIECYNLDGLKGIKAASMVLINEK
jgi:hypothetical protein